MNGDQDTIAKATRDGDTMLGPKERHRCPDHPRRWVVYRWTWQVPEDGDHLTALQSGSEPEAVRACGTCDDEDERESLALLFGDDE